MLGAHLVPGYFAAVKSQSQWNWEWSEPQRILLWTVVLGSTVIPDLDVIYNTLFRGFINHSVLWTHSLFPHLCVGLCWWLLYRTGRWPYLQTLVGLMATGGLSHLALDVIALWYTPVLSYLIDNGWSRTGTCCRRWFLDLCDRSDFSIGAFAFNFSGSPLDTYRAGYEKFNSICCLLAHSKLRVRLGRINEWKSTLQIRALVIIGLISGLILFTITFLLLLSALQSVATSL